MKPVLERGFDNPEVLGTAVEAALLRSVRIDLEARISWR
jgi:hypothetical protein